MVRRLIIKSDSTGDVSAELDEVKCPETSNAIWNALPITGRASCWGEEVYFSTNVSAVEENSQEIVDVGAIAYWPPGQAICIFFGRTPASKDNRPRAASPVNVIGKLLGDPLLFKKVRNGEKIVIERH